MGTRPRVLVIGGGFGGLATARGLARAPVDVVLVDRTNHHLFQPLLYQVATAGLSPADIARPLREVLRRQRNATVLMAEVIEVDPVAKEAQLDTGERLRFDYLVVAVGARHSYFGNDAWETVAPGLKTLDDALDVRTRTLRTFERAERLAIDPERAPQELTFVVVGAGPTGVEMAGAIAEIAQNTMQRNFRHIAPDAARVVLVEASGAVLGAFPEELQRSARRQLEDLGVEVRLDTRVVEIDDRSVVVESADGRETLDTRNVVWAAGNEVPALVRQLAEATGAEVDRQGRAKVSEDLSLPGHCELFVIGDAAHFAGPNGVPLAGVAPVAMQAGQAVAASIRADLRGRTRKPFSYWDRGTMATIGRARAVAWVGRLRFGGLLAWLAWSLIHVAFLIGYRNRTVVMLEWIVLYLTSQRSGRLLYDRPGVIGNDGGDATAPRSA